jgi:hypothetical protein
MNLTRGDKHVYPVSVRTLDRGMHLLDVFRIAAGEATDGRAAILIRNRFNRFEITG